MPALWPGYPLSPGPPSSSCTEELVLIPTLQIFAEKGPFGKSKGKKLWLVSFPSNANWLEQFKGGVDYLLICFKIRETVFLVHG